MTRCAASSAALDVDEARARAHAAGLEMICRCDPGYPPALRALQAPPAVLHVAGGLERLLELRRERPGGDRRLTAGLALRDSSWRARSGAASPCAGITVVSGMALGIDSAAHAGALEAGRADGRGAARRRRSAVSRRPAGAPSPDPRRRRRGVRARAGHGVRRWMFPARNRIIAALSAMTVVVEAGERSGALVTARLARELGRPVGAVPGRVTTPQAAGPNELLATGACVVRGPQDVLDAPVRRRGRAAGRSDRARQPPAELRPLLAAIAEGRETTAALARAGLRPDQGLAALAALELGGLVRRGAGGRFSVMP